MDNPNGVETSVLSHGAYNKYELCLNSIIARSGKIAASHLLPWPELHRLCGRLGLLSYITTEDAGRESGHYKSRASHFVSNPPMGGTYLDTL